MSPEEQAIDEYQLPWKWEICRNCRGMGSHVNRAIDGNGISAEEFAEDPDFEEAYFSGAYDVPCDNGCTGGKAKVLDRDRATPDQIRDYEEWLESHYETEAIYAAERRMGA